MDIKICKCEVCGEVKEIIKMCEEVINGTKVGDLKNCCEIGLECCDCPFSSFNNKNIACACDSDENYVKIAKRYIEDHKDDEEAANFEVFKLIFNSELNNFILDVNMDLLGECNVTEEEFESKFDYDILNKLKDNIVDILKHDSLEDIK